MKETITYSVPGMTCGHCRAAVTVEVGALPGVDSVDVDLDEARRRQRLQPRRGRVAAIDEAGYEAVRP